MVLLMQQINPPETEATQHQPHRRSSVTVTTRNNVVVTSYDSTVIKICRTVVPSFYAMPWQPWRSRMSPAASIHTLCFEPEGSIPRNQRCGNIIPPPTVRFRSSQIIPASNNDRLSSLRVLAVRRDLFNSLRLLRLCVFRI